MVKQSVSCMGQIFSSERFGRPQFLAGLLLLVFLGECVWLIAHEYRTTNAGDEEELALVEQGVAQWRGHGIAGASQAGNAQDAPDPDHSPLWYLIASAPVAWLRVPPDFRSWIWLTRAPYMLIGVLFGASVWYVARRLYGNAGGYIALGLYCFSPAVIRSCALWAAPPNVAPAWGTFGAVFTAIAVSHTLYAPREVVLWNWRRIVLLAVSLTLAAGSLFGMAIVVPVLLGFMLYLAPERKSAAIAILAAACLIAFLLLFASYFFHPLLFVRGLGHARLLQGSWRSATMAAAYAHLLNEIAESGPVLLLFIPVSVVVFASWRRSRYFGNTAPLIVAGLFLILRIFAPHASGAAFGFTATIFFFIFVAGIMADLLETRWREQVGAVVAGLVVANAAWDLLALARVAR
jgi:hypothetical protein